MNATTSHVHNDILDLFHHTISLYPPPHAPHLMSSSPSYRVGEYLVQLGYITQRELYHSLSRCANSGRLGLELITHRLVPTPVLTAVLVLQFLDRFEDDPTTAARFIGERLLLQGQIEAQHLALGLREQIDTSRRGEWVRIGELFVRHGWVDRQVISAAQGDQR